ncbi:MAG: hypothetical protein VX529_10845 [Pseudomonadota bacterium]|jgi:hypothetical protein|nr:hypothetical protein [Pseudomonadota bacterium]
MYLIALAALVLLQDTASAGEPAEEAAAETPAEPADAATLIALTENRWDDWSGVIGELAARTARERFAADLVYPVIARTDLEEGARGPIMQAGLTRIGALVDENTDWAAAQLDAETFPDFYTLQPRPARELLRMAERDDANLGRIVAALEPVVLAGGYDAAAFAALADRHALAEDRAQPYGTQSHCAEGTVTLYEIAEPDTLAERRESIGLPPLDREAAEGATCEVDTTESG